MNMPAAFRRPARRRVPRIELDTPIVPRAVAEGVWEEAGAWLGQPLPRREMAAQAFHHVCLAVLERHVPVCPMDSTGHNQWQAKARILPRRRVLGLAHRLFRHRDKA
jgi:hypothetical protein